MSNDLQRVLDKITQHGQAGRIRARHDTARLRGPNPNPRVANFDQFTRVIGAFVNKQIELAGGQRYPDFEARAIAKEILSQQERRTGKTFNNYARDAIDGRNGGLRAVLDILTDTLREQQTSRYIGDAIDQVVDPLDYDRKVAVTRQVLAHYQRLSPGAVSDPRPEVHAHDYSTLLREVAAQVDKMNENLRGH